MLLGIEIDDEIVFRDLIEVDPVVIYQVLQTQENDVVVQADSILPVVVQAESDDHLELELFSFAGESWSGKTNILLKVFVLHCQLSHLGSLCLNFLLAIPNFNYRQILEFHLAESDNFFDKGVVDEGLNFMNVLTLEPIVYEQLFVIKIIDLCS